MASEDEEIEASRIASSANKIHIIQFRLKPLNGNDFLFYIKR